MADVIDHIAIRVSDLERSRAFYAAVLGALGMEQLYTRGSGDPTGPGVAFGREGADDFAIHAPIDDPGRDTVAHGVHLAFRAESADQVQAFHAAGLRNGGRDIGAPGPRPEYSERYYGGFLLDPDGNNVEAVYHSPVALEQPTATQPM
jgi:catechol 2,3-dioxygenase-like lactoylglutathione lyase family enzyme